jgi:hypothetical protein
MYVKGEKGEIGGGYLLPHYVGKKEALKAPFWC